MLKIFIIAVVIVAIIVLFTKAAAEDRKFRQSELYRRAKALEIESQKPGWIGAPLSFYEAKQRVEFLMKQEGEIKD